MTAEPTQENTRPMRLAVVLASLTGGGMERMRLHLMHEWVKNGIDVDLVVRRFEGPLCELVPDEVSVFEIARTHPMFFAKGLRRYVRQRQPTHVLSAGHDINLLTLLALKKMSHDIPIVVSVHAHPSIQVANSRGLKRWKLKIAHWGLRRLAQHSRGVIAVSHGVGKELKIYWSLRGTPVHVIYNPTITRETLKALRAPLEKCPVPTNTPWILFVGRFDYQKGLDILIEAFDAVAAAQSKAHLVLMGSGNMDGRVTRHIKRSGLQRRIHIINFKSNPLPWIREADVLVLSSRYEGLPNVLIEALACGTQIVATDCPSGPAEILDSGRYGQLVPVDDPDAMSTAMLRSLSREYYVEPLKLRQRSQLFTASRAAAQYFEILTGRPMVVSNSVDDKR